MASVSENITYIREHLSSLGFEVFFKLGNKIRVEVVDPHAKENRHLVTLLEPDQVEEFLSVIRKVYTQKKSNKTNICAGW